MPRDADGKRQQKRITVKGTKRDAERERTKLQREIDTGAFVKPESLTVGKYLAEWLGQVKSTVSPKTHQTEAGLIRTQVVPALGGKALQKLTPHDIQTFYSR